MHTITTLKLILFAIVTDRAVHAGGSTSALALWGGQQLSPHHFASIASAQEAIAFYATVAGALGATATLVYVCLKIWRLLRNPGATE